MQVLPPVQLARSRVRGAAAREGRAPARPPARRAMDPRRLGRDKRDPPVRRIRRVTMWCRGRGRRPRRPARPMAFPCTCRAASVATSATLPYPARNGPAPPSVATSATLPCAVSAGLPCGAVVGADVLGGPRVRWRFRVRAEPQSDVPCRGRRGSFARRVRLDVPHRASPSAHGSRLRRHTEHTEIRYLQKPPREDPPLKRGADIRFRNRTRLRLWFPYRFVCNP